MNGWSKIQSSISGLQLGNSANKFAKGLQSSVQATRERLGAVNPEDITELPSEYRELEARVDALKAAHLAFLKIAKVYADSSYDYPTQIQESLGEFGATVSHSLTTFAATNLKGTALPVPNPSPPTSPTVKTLPHAVSRGAAVAARALEAPGGPETRLGQALKEYSLAYEKIGAARLDQDDAIVNRFLAPWQVTLNNSITLAIKARQAVRVSRLELDAAKQRLKGAIGPKQDQAKLEVENAEDDLVQKTEVAIQLMKTVLENPEPIKNLNELAKAQLLYHSQITETLQAVQGEIEELAVAAEGEYRKSRDH
ncbi:BAR domain-containing family protein [Cantharellus anzutake]|uniref:BAR domain-containing family protein n=1 Tax=Cantharellus anzutake TaxID=1750568 RepID=UPI00190616A6|nr:BAR domain-containing family protein [Cantharellus anzutake]KAF8337355.1 BAR domain-containing family protein [Cantharellus anzutake]